MSVLIRGMKMPDNCHECVAGYGGYCYVCPAEEDGCCPDHGRPDWCPLIELPQHGRLIDADALIERYKPDMNRQIYGGNFIFDIEHMPTIIEPEDGT